MPEKKLPPNFPPKLNMDKRRREMFENRNSSREARAWINQNIPRPQLIPPDAPRVIRRRIVNNNPENVAILFPAFD